MTGIRLHCSLIGGLLFLCWNSIAYPPFHAHNAAVYRNEMYEYEVRAPPGHTICVGYPGAPISYGILIMPQLAHCSYRGDPYSIKIRARFDVLYGLRDETEVREPAGETGFDVTPPAPPPMKIEPQKLFGGYDTYIGEGSISKDGRYWRGMGITLPGDVPIDIDIDLDAPANQREIADKFFQDVIASFRILRDTPTTR